MGDEINIVCAADSNYVIPTAVLLRSISDHNGSDVRVWLSASNLRGDVIKRLEHRLAFSLEVVSQADFEVPNISLPPHMTPPTLMRLFLSHLLPRHVGRCIYLDVDTLVRASLRPLFDSDLGACSLAAVRDPGLPWHGMAGSGFPWRATGYPPDTPYFNAGVLLVDVDAWRKADVGGHALNFLAKQPVPWGDQCGLNAAVGPAWKQLDPKWNLQSAHLIDQVSLAWVTEDGDALAAAIHDPSLVHFTESALRRPWHRDCTHPFRDEWLATLRETAWSDWLPRRRPLWPRFRRRATAIGRAARTGRA
jgi:lipopolysaccharide biosynthesis glycosyltransferase